MKSKTLKNILCGYLLFSISFAHAVGKETATAAKVVGGVLVGVGVYDLYKATMESKATGGARAMEVAKSLLEIAGGVFAMMVNASTEEQLASDSTTTSGTSGGSGGATELGSTPTITESTIANICDQYPTYCETDSTTGLQTVTLPPVEDLKKDVVKSFAGNSVDPDGLSLDEALGKLDDSYKKANQAVSALNSGYGSPAAKTLLADSELAGVGSDTGEDKTVGLNVADKAKNPLVGSDNPAVLIDSPALASVDLNKLKEERAIPEAVKINGLNTEKASNGRLLTIFERVTRAIRGSRDRDLLLAKIEMSRKKTLGNPNVTATKVTKL